MILFNSVNLQIPGDLERESLAKSKARAGNKDGDRIILDYHDKLMAKMNDLAKAQKVKPMQPYIK